MQDSSLQFHGKKLKNYVSKESRSEILRLQRAFRKLSDIEEKYAKELRNLSRSDLDFGKNAMYLFFIPHTHISSIHSKKSHILSLFILYLLTH